VQSKNEEGKMKKISMAMLVALSLAIVACGEEKAAEVAKPEPAAKVDEAPAPAEPAKAEPAKPAEPAPVDPAPAAAVAEPPKAPESVALQIEGAKKGPVTFPHAAHVALPAIGGKCNACHHTADEKGVGAQKCTASGCHDGKGKVAAKDAFHDTCRGCHTKELAAQPQNEKLKALKSCKGCHAG
jgi:hypothetical protein